MTCVKIVSMMHYHSMVGMVLMGDDGLLNEMPLCTIDDLVVQAGFRGKVTVQVTLLAVARAKIQDFTQMKPIMMATARELKDDTVHDLSVASKLVNDIESTIQDLGLRERYDEAIRLALESDTQVHDVTNDTSFDEKSVADITAASWAVFTCVSNKACLSKAIASTSLIDRLELGLKALLDEKYQASAISNGEGDAAFQ